MNRKAYFVTGIHTDAGKTVVSAFLQAALDAEYWKPIQAGDLDFGDTDRVKAWTGADPALFHPVRHELNTPASPHYAAMIDGVTIKLDDFAIPAPLSTKPATSADAPQRADAELTSRPLLIEGAGGILVPVNDQETVADLMVHLGLPVILVSRHYLGSINHTLLSVEYLRSRGLIIAGLIHSGGDSPETVRIIKKLTGVAPLVELPELTEVNQQELKKIVATHGPILRKGLGL